ncbi:MAG TPA: ComEC/Rec2 family competence protein [Sphingobacterium sp.]|nr:ComEC/Rec2 family competence protein [Sphingobacterium sp.]
MVKHNILDLSIGKVPMVKILLPYILGIGCGKYWVWSPLNALTFFCLTVILIAGLAFTNFSKGHRLWKRSTMTGLYILLFFIVGYWFTIKTDPSIRPDYFASIDTPQYIGIIDDEPIIREKSIRFPLKIVSAQRLDSTFAVSGTVMVSISRDSLSAEVLQYGDIIALKNTISKVDPPFNPKEFDYKAYLQNRNIWHQCYLRPHEYKLLSSGAGNIIIRHSLSIRERLIEKFSVYMYNSEAFQVAIALIFGYRSQIDAATLQAFSNTGTIHVLSVSGLHVGLVFGLLTLLLGWIDRIPFGKYIRCGIIAVCVWAYVILTGMAPPILRAGIMISFFLVSTVIGRKQIPLNTLAASAFFILLFTPKALFDLGFQLSYMAMIGILLLYPLLTNLYLPTNKYLSWVVAYAYVSIAAQLFTLPFVLYYFGQFPNYFLFANLFISLPSTAVMYVGLALAVLPFDMLNVLLGRILDFLLVFCLDGLQWFEHLPYAVIQGIDWSFLLLFLCLLYILIIVIALNNTNKRMILYGLFLLFIMSVTTSYQMIAKKHYTGWKLYNMRSAFALAHIHYGNAILYSSYDSLAHPNILFSVMPDLLQYSKRNHITFVKIENDKRQNSLISIDGQRIALIERQWLDTSMHNLDVMIWRKNNWASLDSAKKYLKQDGILIFDGSNSEKYLEKFSDLIQKNHPRTYLLKKNFAYVWENN